MCPVGSVGYSVLSWWPVLGVGVEVQADNTPTRGVWERQVTQIMPFCLGTGCRSNSDHAALGSLVCML